MSCDIITLGEAMIRLAPPNFKRLEQADTLDLEIGGAELNTAVGLARLGHSVSWVSRLTENALGRLIVNRARETGVKVDDILLTPHDRVGVYFLEFGAAPRPSGIIYDRTDSAMAKLQPGTIDWRRIFTGAKWFYITGITAALSPSASEAALEALRIAQSMGVKTCLDPNYRAKLWTVEQAAAWLTRAIPHVNVLISNPEDLERFFGIPGSDLEAATSQTVERYKLDALALTLRKTHSVLRNGWTALAAEKGRLLQGRQYEVEIVDRLGAGDAFAAGFIHGLMQGDLQMGLDWGLALSALKHTIPGDLPWISRDEVENLLRGDGLRIRR